MDIKEILKLAGPSLGMLTAQGGPAQAAFMQSFQQGAALAEQERQRKAQEAQQQGEAGARYSMSALEKLQAIEDPDQFYQMREEFKRNAPVFGGSPDTIDAIAYPESKRLRVIQKEAKELIDILVKRHGENVLEANAKVPFQGRMETPQGLLNIAGMQATDAATGEPYKRPKPPTAAPGSFEDYLAAPPERQAEIERARRSYSQADDPATKPEGPYAAQKQKADLDLVLQRLHDAKNPKPDKAQGPNPNQQFSMEERLAKSWTSSTQSAREVERQLAIMQTGLQRFRQGDKNGGSQAVLVTFQKILDPTSVVRESEYARTTAGQAFLDRIQGHMLRIKEGGTTLTDAEMAAMVETAAQFSTSLKRHTAGQRRRIEAQAKQYGLNPAGIFDDVLMGDTPPPAETGAVEDWTERDPTTGKLRRKR